MIYGRRGLNLKVGVRRFMEGLGTKYRESTGYRFHTALYTKYISGTDSTLHVLKIWRIGYIFHTTLYTG